MYGLDDITISKIIKIFSNHIHIDEVILYGSRAIGNYRTGSDIDITLIGNNLTLKNSIYPIMDELDELYLPYMFDISIYSHIKDQNLIEHIKKVGKVLYKKK